MLLGYATNKFDQHPDGVTGLIYMKLNQGLIDPNHIAVGILPFVDYLPTKKAGFPVFHGYSQLPKGKSI